MSKDTIVVVGGAGDIGSSVVEKYIAEGHNVVVGDINREAGELVAARYDNAEFCHLDITLDDSRRNFFHTVGESYGGIHHLVSLAGGSIPEEKVPLGQLDPDDIRRSARVNGEGQILLINDAVPLMEETEGDKSIALTSSICAKASYGVPTYSFAKAGILGLCTSTAYELSQKGIRINCIVLGTVPTERLVNGLHSASTMEAYRERSMLGRFISQQEVADVFYGMTHRFRSMTGAGILLDMGQSINMGKLGAPKLEN